jgi:hypothetical protein
MQQGGIDIALQALGSRLIDCMDVGSGLRNVTLTKQKDNISIHYRVHYSEIYQKNKKEFMTERFVDVGGG